MAKDILDDLFNASPTIQNPEDAQNSIAEFKPAAKKGQGGIYEAVIRFIPNPEDPSNKSIVSKNTVFLENPLTHAKMEVDCPSTVGQPDPIQDTFFNLRNSDNPTLKENSKKFSRRQRYTSLIQVLTCKSEPQLVGKILVWRYGIKIHDKIYAEQNPPMGAPRNPFNMFVGRPMYIKVKEVSGFNNFDDCQFLDLQNPADGALKIEIANAQGNMVWQPITLDIVNQNPQIKQLVFNYLKEKCPSLEPFAYHEWDENTRKFVQSCIDIYSNPQASMAAATGSSMQSNPYMQSPAMNPTVTPVVPQSNPVPQMPTGLQMGTPASQMNTTTPGGFNPTSIPGIGNGELDSILNAGTPSAVPSAPQMGMSLDDVLSGVL